VIFGVWSSPKHFFKNHLLSLFGLEKIICYQLKNGAEADMKNTDGHSPLSYDADKGHETVVKQLVEHNGINVNSKDIHGNSPLWFAAKNGHGKVLLEHKDMEVNSWDKFGCLSLSYAATKRHETVVKLLLEHNDVEVNSKDLWDSLPLSYTAKGGHEAVVKLLLKQHEVEVNSRNKSGCSPDERAAELLVEQNTDLNGWTPLLYGAKYGHENIRKSGLLHMTGDFV
jgi:ankyrin repeat protein